MKYDASAVNRMLTRARSGGAELRFSSFARACGYQLSWNRSTMGKYNPLTPITRMAPTLPLRS